MPITMPTNTTVVAPFTTEVFMAFTRMPVIAAEVPLTSMVSLVSADMTPVVTAM